MILRFNNRVLTYSGLTLNYVPQLEYFSGGTLSGWTVNGGGTGFPTIDNTFGNPFKNPSPCPSKKSLKSPAAVFMFPDRISTPIASSPPAS